jgi:uncharacterized iron-regulated membrane protein
MQSRASTFAGFLCFAAFILAALSGASGSSWKCSATPALMFFSMAAPTGISLSGRAMRTVKQHLRGARFITTKPWTADPTNEVADELDITIETVRTYVKRICLKIHVRSKPVHY